MRRKFSDCDVEVRTAQTGERFDIALIEKLLPQLARIAKLGIARRWQAKVAASDILQDTFLEAARTLPTFSGRTVGEFNEWLRAILTNNFLDTRRKFVDVQKRAVAREKSLDCLASQLLPAQDPPTSRVAEANEFDHELHLVIQGLDPIDRQILTFRYQQELTFPEIGERVGMKEDAVRKRWGRILVALQHRLRNFDSCASVRKAKSLAAGCP